MILLGIRTTVIGRVREREENEDLNEDNLVMLMEVIGL